MSDLRLYYLLLYDQNCPIRKPEIKRLYRERAKRCLGVDPLAVSMREGWRYASDEDSLTEYRILADHGETDDEIQEYCNSLNIPCNSPYDCTGRLFTAWITWKRVPCGIVIIHEKRLDV